MASEFECFILEPLFCLSIYIMTETADQHISAIQSSNYEQIQEDQHSNNFEDFQVEKKVFNITENMNFISIFR